MLENTERCLCLVLLRYMTGLNVKRTRVWHVVSLCDIFCSLRQLDFDFMALDLELCLSKCFVDNNPSRASFDRNF